MKKIVEDSIEQGITQEGAKVVKKVCLVVVVCGVWCVVCGVWCVVCGVWCLCVVCGVWCVVCSVCVCLCVCV